MAIPRTARVVGVDTLGADTRIVELTSDEPLGFIGGQYLIIDSGLIAPGGKAIKRAYSLMTPDAEQRRFRLAVKRLPDGPGSSFLHELERGAEVRFSGPWGKLYPEQGATGPALVLATDTGITAALGLLSSARFAPLLGQCTFAWLRTAPDYFLPERFVEAALPEGLRDAHLGLLPGVGHPGRLSACQAILREAHGRAPLRQAFIAGDGAVNYALLDDLVAIGVPATRDSVESFFNMPRKSAVA
jgi:ferredoxin-NADP reductase